MATRTVKIPRALTREDGRERVAVPFWNGVLSALGAIAIGFALMLVTMIVAIAAVVLGTGRLPSTDPGHPLAAAGEIVFYGGGAAFAWWRIRAMGLRPFRKLTRFDVRAILIGVAMLALVRIGNSLILVLTNKTEHVQSGFEHFDVKTAAPALTALSAGLAIVTIVIVAPVVEELVFRGLLFGALAKRLGIIASALITAVLFGLVHGDPILFPSIAALGFITAVAYAATGNLWVAIVLHASNNSIGAVALVTTSLAKH